MNFRPFCPTAALGVGYVYPAHCVSSLFQDGGRLPEDAPHGAGGGLLSSAQLGEAVPGALPHALHCGAAEITQVIGVFSYCTVEFGTNIP